MKKLVGIRGHRGAGKDSVAFLLACALDFIDCSDELEINNEESRKQRFDEIYETVINKLKDNKDKTFSEANFKFVYLDAFGDAPKAMVQQLLGCDFKYLWDEYWKDHAIVDLQTFNIEEVDVLPDNLIESTSLNEFSNGKMSLREFILYFGQTVMQKYFGRDVWVKSTAQNDKRNEEYLSNGIRIYTDIKAPTELSYLIDKQAVIINVERKGYKKTGGLDLLVDDNRYDYMISIKGNDLMSIKDTIWEIANKIYFGNE